MPIMLAMRPLLVLAAVALLVTPFAVAQEAHQHHHLSISLDTPVPNAVTPTGVTRTFMITARQWSYTISPSPFKANVGDTVVINATSSDVRHGLLMERYILKALVLDKGKTSSTTFVADQPGSFVFLCDQPACGIGHSEMDGNFDVEVATLPAPTISSVQPTTGTTAGGTAVTITGTNFQSGTTVKFGSVAASSVNVQSATSIVATAPAQAAGAVTITVTNPDGQSVTANGYTYVVPPPAISGVTPATGPSNGGTLVEIDGSGFQSGATVTFGGKPAQSVPSVSSTAILAITPAGSASEEQGVPLDVTVRNPDGQSVTKTQAFQYTSAPLSISIVSVERIECGRYARFDQRQRLHVGAQRRVGDVRRRRGNGAPRRRCRDADGEDAAARERRGRRGGDDGRPHDHGPRRVHVRDRAAAAADDEMTGRVYHS